MAWEIQVEAFPGQQQSMQACTTEKSIDNSHLDVEIPHCSQGAQVEGLVLKAGGLQAAVSDMEVTVAGSGGGEQREMGRVWQETDVIRQMVVFDGVFMERDGKPGPGGKGGEEFPHALKK